MNFNDAPTTLDCKIMDLNIVVLVGDFNAQIGRIRASEACLSGHFVLPVQHTGNGSSCLVRIAYTVSVAQRHATLAPQVL